MRRTLAVLMLMVLMFNMGGYFILYTLLETRAETMMNAAILGDSVSAKDQVEFKLSFEMPYPVYDQRVELEVPNRLKTTGQTYSITTHSYSDNTLTIVGVRDQWAMHVDAVMSAFNKTASGDTSDEGLINSLNNLLQTFIGDDAFALMQCDSWKRLLNPVEYSQLFASVDQPSDPRPPCA